MNLITEQDIDTILGSLSGADKNPFPQLLTIMAREQPDLFEYLRDAEGDEFNTDERAMLGNVSAITWHLVKKTAGCGRVSADYLDLRLQRNIDLIGDQDHDDRGADEPGGSLAGILSEYNEQPLLMTFIVNLVADRPADYDGNVRDEMLPVLIMHLKTVVDALILPEEEHFDEEDVGEYSDEDFARARETVAEMYAGYAGGPFHAVLEDGHRVHAETIVTAFGEIMYEYFLLAPAGWNVRRAAECCTEILPDKVRERGGSAGSIVPVLVSFLGFAAGSGDMPEAAYIAERLLEIKDRIA